MIKLINVNESWVNWRFFWLKCIKHSKFNFIFFNEYKVNMDIPFYSQQDLWRKLSSDQIGFFTEKTSSKIPQKPGIYAWFLPIDIRWDLSAEIKRCKSYYNYDSKVKGSYSLKGQVEFQWARFKYEACITEDYRVQSTLEKKWRDMSSSLSTNDFKALRQTINLTSIFSKPLYVGLTKNLSGRYEQHLTGSGGNDFHKRFKNFSNIKGLVSRLAN